MPIQSCLIVGAGMSGLMAARVLQGAGLTVTLLDKGRGVGGRMATRRIEDGVFDHGAQFFTVRDSRFQKFVDEWLASGLVSEWSSGFADAAGHYSPDGHPRYRGNAGMNSIAKALAQGLDVQVSTQVKRIDLNGHGWHLETEDGKGFSAQSLILTAPVPQSLALLDAGSYRLADDHRAALEKVEYQPCIAVMALLDKPTRIPEPGALQIRGEPLSWVADNQRKGISGAYGVTIHAGPEFTRAHWDDLENAGRKLLDEIQPWLGDAQVITQQVHRWRYSMPTVLYPETHLLVPGEFPLAFAGDAFNGPRVEGAAVSGIMVGEALLSS